MRILRRLAALAAIAISALGLTYTETPASATPCIACEIFVPSPSLSSSCDFYANYQIVLMVSLSNPWLYHFNLSTPNVAYDAVGGREFILGTRFPEWARIDPTFAMNAYGYRNLRIGSLTPLHLSLETSTQAGFYSIDKADFNVDLSAPVTQIELPFTGYRDKANAIYAKLTFNARQTTTATWHC